MSRTVERTGLQADFHLRLIDDDLDRFEEAVERVETRLANQTRAIYALVVSVSTAALMLAVNLVSR